MMELKWAKRVMEHEEGMNHLWISLGDLPEGSQVEVEVECPAGFYRAPNLNGYPESADGTVRISSTEGAVRDVVYEVGVRGGVSYESAEFRIRVRCTALDGHRSERECLTRVGLSREEAFDPMLDEEVVVRVASLLTPPAAIPEEETAERDPWPCVTVPPVIRTAELSEWEQKYRIDCRPPYRPISPFSE
ncbi:hypothetical protein ACVNS2_25245 [Paenibacillus caseinilyticus]|nr:hypothetical protein [Paenibacillus mucilaginosus]